MCPGPASPQNVTWTQCAELTACGHRKTRDAAALLLAAEAGLDLEVVQVQGVGPLLALGGGGGLGLGGGAAAGLRLGVDAGLLLGPGLGLGGDPGALAGGEVVAALLLEVVQFAQGDEHGVFSGGGGHDLLSSQA